MKKVFFASINGFGTKLIPFSSLKARNAFVENNVGMYKVSAKEGWAFVHHTCCENLYKANGIKYTHSEKINFSLKREVAGE